MVNGPYHSPASVRAWQCRSPLYHTTTRISRAFLSFGLWSLQVPLVILDFLIGGSYYGRKTWGLPFRIGKLAFGYVLWTLNPGTLPPADVVDMKARSSTGKLSKQRKAALVMVQPREDLLFGDAIHQNVKLEETPCFWMWTGQMNDMANKKTATEGEKIVMYFVGGGMVQGHPAESPLGWKLIQSTKIPVFGVNFRKCVTAPNAFPAALQDAVAAFYFLLDAGYKAENISIMGDSGGGGIVITTVLYLLRHKLELPGSVLLVSPWVDFQGQFKENEELLRLDMMNPEMLSIASYQYVENRPELRSTLLSPSRNQLPKGYSFSGFPSTLIWLGDAEMFGPSIISFINVLRGEKVDVDVVVGKDETHCFPYVSKDRSPGSFYGRAKAILGVE